MRPRSDSAFSLVEVLIGLSVAAILAILSVATVTRVVSSSKDQKLASDAETLNRAVAAFVASGGDASSLKSADEVLDALRKQSRDARRTPGMAGAFIDPRIQFASESPEEAQKNLPRLYWNSQASRFEVASDRDEPGIVSVTLDGTEEAGGTDADDRSSALLYAKQGDWIWDYADVPLPASPGTVEIPLGTPTDSTPTPPSGTGTPPTPGVVPLDPPGFSIAGGTYPKSSFPLSLSLSDPNPAGRGEVYYSVDYGNWLPYKGTIQVQAGNVVAAQVVPVTSGYSSSARVEESYQPVKEPLAPPSIQLSSLEFNDQIDSIGIRIDNSNDPATSDVFYTLVAPGVSPPSRSLWTSYSGNLLALSSAFPTGFSIVAYSRAKDPTAYIDSANAQADAGALFTLVSPDTGKVLYVIDVSGSMDAQVGTSTRLKLVQNALIDAISQLDSGTRFNVISFAGSVQWSDGTWDLLKATAVNKALLATQIGNWKTAGGTNYQAALAAPMQFKTKPEKVYFLTDGEPTVGGDNYQQEVSALASAGIIVNTIGVDLNAAAEQRLNNIAKKTGGSAAVVTTD
ncbi:MAG: VWA domain-containing protein [Verrucomicrobiae bacterium]|nr:VWA domain-containing protein [Verrucomicrobiae bacterium]